jgi:serine/threonine-protein kinase HipA
MLVDVAEVEGLPGQFYDEPGRAFAIQRFDRVEGRRIHIEDFAQVLGLTSREKYGHANYESIARILAAVAPEDADEMVRRLVFLVLSGNGDAHVKNWSLIYPDGVRPRLAPAYDLLNTTAFVTNDDLALRLGGTKAFEEVTVATFRRFASRARLDESAVEAAVLAQIDATLDAWELTRSTFAGPDRVAAEIDRRLGTLPLATNRARGA